MGGAARLSVAFDLSEAVRRITLAGIRHRHPEYSDEAVSAALAPLTLGDALYRLSVVLPPARHAVEREEARSAVLARVVTLLEDLAIPYMVIRSFGLQFKRRVMTGYARASDRVRAGLASPRAGS